MHARICTDFDDDFFGVVVVVAPISLCIPAATAVIQRSLHTRHEMFVMRYATTTV